MEKIDDKFNRILRELNQLYYDINRDVNYTREEILSEIDFYIGTIEDIINEK